MSGQSTVISAGGATVASAGIYTAQAIQEIQALLNKTGSTVVEIYGQDGVPPVPTVPGGQQGNYVLIIPNGVTVPGSLSIPAGYGGVLIGSGTSASLTGGDSHTTIVSGGNLAYTGGAGSVGDSGGTATVDDTANGAVMSFGGGADSVTAAGNGQVVRVDNGSVDFTATGTGDTFDMGDPTSGGAAAAADISSVSTFVVNLTPDATGSVVNINSGSTEVNDHAGSTTINGIGGSATIFAATNDVYFGGGASAEFIGAGTSQTVFGGSGNNTVFGNAADSAIVDHFGTGYNIFVDEAASATVFGAGTGAIFGGSGSTDAILGNGDNVFVGLGGSDSVYGGNVTPTVFATSNEMLTVVGSHAAFEVALGNNDVISAANTEGGNNFFAISSTGNTTLTGSAGSGSDTFNLVNTGGGTAHTITIQNWHTGDGLFLASYGASDIATMDNAINGGSSTFTLSDGTTVTFQGDHPQHAIGTGAF